MKKQKLILLLSLIFSFSLFAVYAYAVTGVSHDPSEITCTSSFCVDSANIRLGIGTATPAQELHIYRENTNARIRLQRSDDPVGGYIIRNYYSSASGYTLDVLTQADNSSGTLKVFGSGTGAMTTSFDGNVGTSLGITAQKYYDPDDAGGATYYMDPSGTSRFNTVCLQGDCRNAWPSGGGTLTGSGTANYIPKWTAATALGNSQIFDNGTNVGIGTATPNAPLDVKGANGYSVSIAAEGTIAAGYNLSVGNEAVISGNAGVGGGVTAQIFYDANDTSYYVNPASDSVIRNLRVGGVSTSRHNTYLTVNRGSPDRGVLRFSTGGSVDWNMGMFYGCGTNYTNFYIGQTDYVNDCSSTYYPEVQISKSGGMTLRPRDGNLYIRTDTNGDSANIQVRTVFTTGIGNAMYGGDININPAGNLVIQAGGKSVVIRDGTGGNSANVQVYTLHVNQICLNGVCKTSW